MNCKTCDHADRPECRKTCAEYTKMKERNEIIKSEKAKKALVQDFLSRSYYRQVKQRNLIDKGKRGQSCRKS